jgi:hypothetical protein
MHVGSKQKDAEARGLRRTVCMHVGVDGKNAEAWG